MNMWKLVLQSLPTTIMGTTVLLPSLSTRFVDHAIEYVRGNVHTNGLENFWSLLKRGLHGTYLSVEPFHLFRYVDEQPFRYNTRKNADGDKITDGERFNMALSKIVGKRLTYAQLTGKELVRSNAE